MNTKSSLFKELQRRNVFKVAVAYLIASWLLAQVADLVLHSFGAPDWTMRALLVALAIGFPIAMAISWTFEVTSKGVIPESEIDRTISITDQSGKRLDRIIILILAIVVVFMGLERFVFSGHARSLSWQSAEQPPAAEIIPETELVPPVAALPTASSYSVAVLPFAVMSTGPDDDYFADGLTEEIINALSQLPDLKVTARTSAFHFKGQNLPIGEIAQQLGVANLVEGSVRRAGDQLRITAQLVRAEDGFHIWSETYDRRTEDTFAVQQDIAEQVATALNVLLDEELRGRMQHAGLRNVEAFTAYQQAREWYSSAHETGADIGLLRRGAHKFEEVIALVPDYPDAYIQHGDLYSHILLSQASGQLDGNITEQDIQQAAARLPNDYDQGMLYARTVSERQMIEFDRALFLGEWRGLRLMNERALAASDCQVPYWTHLVSLPFGMARELREAYTRMLECDPLEVRARTHVAYADLWMGEPVRAMETASAALQIWDHHMLVWVEMFALASEGRFGQAESAIEIRPLPADEKLYLGSLLMAMQGRVEAARQFQEDLLGQFGPNDQASLVMEAARGNRSEANRLAGLIDRRPFGYLSLMQAILQCACGAPFELQATPVFAGLIEESGLQWPPDSPITYPLKDW